MYKIFDFHFNPGYIFNIKSTFHLPTFFNRAYCYFFYHANIKLNFGFTWCGSCFSQLHAIKLFFSTHSANRSNSTYPIVALLEVYNTWTNRKSISPKWVVIITKMSIQEQNISNSKYFQTFS